MVNRFRTRIVQIGDLPLGGDHPVRLQSMTSTSTLDTEATVSQCIRIFEAGADYVRITTPGTREAENLLAIRSRLHLAGFHNPLIADIHFNPAAAETAARIVEKIRINPGNYADPRNLAKSAYTESQYKEELERIHARILPLIKICKEYGTAVRIGTNHGSLSERIVNRFGDTPEGMAESAMEFVRIFEQEGFHSLVLSMKASNTLIMIRSTRLLVQRMQAEGMNYPIHLGVTEAGEGEDGRIRSAVGIGTLLQEGIGDTLRVSLTEEPEFEIPVAKSILKCCQERQPVCVSASPLPLLRDAEEKKFFWNKASFRAPEKAFLKSIDEADPEASGAQNIVWVASGTGRHPSDDWKRQLNHYREWGLQGPVILKRTYTFPDLETLQLQTACDFGPMLEKDLAQGIWIDVPEDILNAESVRSTALNILQACRVRMSKPEYISCPSCGRTLYNIQKTAAEIRKRTSHLTGLKIGIMGCIVNGPGEMADADYGYVGAAPGKVSLYKGKELIRKNIPASGAVEALIELIKASGDWRES